MQESYDIDGERPHLGSWLAAQLGWQAYQGDSPHLCILTKFTIAETFTHEPWHGIGARIQAPGGDILAWSCWIDYRAYLPYHQAEHPEASVDDLLECETTRSNRANQTKALLARLHELGHLNSTLPLLVGGDWNSPSHLDYDEDTKQLHHGLVVPIPTSLAFEAAGFRGYLPQHSSEPAGDARRHLDAAFPQGSGNRTTGAARPDRPPLPRDSETAPGVRHNAACNV